MVIVTTAALAEPATCSTEVTLPTLTPAIRTGEARCSWVWAVNIALRTNGEPPNGVEPPNTR